MTNPTISVLMPAYNSERFINEAIQSILLQSFRDFELIILNDGSTDTSKDIIFSNSDSRIKYFESEKKGIVYQLNKGINIAKGEYIARMDSDDVSHPERLEKQIGYLIQNKDFDGIGTSYFLINTSRKIIFQKSVPLGKMECEFMAPLSTPILHPTLMMRTDVIKNIGGYLEKYNLIEDYDLFMRLIGAGYKLGNFEEPLYYYRYYNETQRNEKEKIQKNKTYCYGKKHLLDKLRSDPNNDSVHLQLAMIEYYKNNISASRKYFLSFLKIKPTKIYIVFRYIPILFLGDRITKYLRDNGYLSIISEFIHSKLGVDFYKLYKTDPRFKKDGIDK